MFAFFLEDNKASLIRDYNGNKLGCLSRKKKFWILAVLLTSQRSALETKFYFQFVSFLTLLQKTILKWMVEDYYPGSPDILLHKKKTTEVLYTSYFLKHWTNRIFQDAQLNPSTFSHPCSSNHSDALSWRFNRYLSGWVFRRITSKCGTRVSKR